MTTEMASMDFATNMASIQGSRKTALENVIKSMKDQYEELTKQNVVEQRKECESQLMDLQKKHDDVVTDEMVTLEKQIAEFLKKESFMNTFTSFGKQLSSIDKRKQSFVKTFSTIKTDTTTQINNMIKNKIPFLCNSLTVSTTIDGTDVFATYDEMCQWFWDFFNGLKPKEFNADGIKKGLQNKLKKEKKTPDEINEIVEQEITKQKETYDKELNGSIQLNEMMTILVSSAVDGTVLTPDGTTKECVVIGIYKPEMTDKMQENFTKTIAKFDFAQFKNLFDGCKVFHETENQLMILLDSTDAFKKRDMIQAQIRDHLKTIGVYVENTNDDDDEPPEFSFDD